MIVRTKSELTGTDRVTHTDNWSSHRFLLARDGQNFSFHDTTLHAGTETKMWYRYHVEAVYCVGGTGELEDLETGEVHQIADGTMYCLDGHERHILRAHTDLRMICVFDPPVTGQETHDEDGAYPLLTEN